MPRSDRTDAILIPDADQRGKTAKLVSVPSYLPDADPGNDIGYRWRKRPYLAIRVCAEVT
jgi:hypothetical protein